MKSIDSVLDTMYKVLDEMQPTMAEAFRNTVDTGEWWDGKFDHNNAQRVTGAVGWRNIKEYIDIYNYYPLTYGYVCFRVRFTIDNTDTPTHLSSDFQYHLGTLQNYNKFIQSEHINRSVYNQVPFDVFNEKDFHKRAKKAFQSLAKETVPLTEYKFSSRSSTYAASASIIKCLNQIRTLTQMNLEMSGGNDDYFEHLRDTVENIMDDMKKEYASRPLLRDIAFHNQ